MDSHCIVFCTYKAHHHAKFNAVSKCILIPISVRDSTNRILAVPIKNPREISIDFLHLLTKSHKYNVNKEITFTKLN